MFGPTAQSTVIERAVFDWQVAGGSNGDLTGSEAAEVAVLRGAWSGDIAGLFAVETDRDDGHDVLHVVVVVVVAWKLLGHHLILWQGSISVDGRNSRGVGVASVGTRADVVSSVGHVGDWLWHDDGLDRFDDLLGLNVALAAEAAGAGGVIVVWRGAVALLLAVVQPYEQLEQSTEEEQAANRDIS